MVDEKKLKYISLITAFGFLIFSIISWRLSYELGKRDRIIDDSCMTINICVNTTNKLIKDLEDCGCYPSDVLGQLPNLDCSLPK